MTDHRKKKIDRNKSIIIRVTEQEHTEAYSIAHKAEMTLSEYTRKLLFSNKGHL